MDEERFAQTVAKIGVSLSPEQIAAFSAFEDALFEANEVMNLTRVPREDCWLRHFVDSLLLQDLIPVGSRVLDIGTGPGFPAWPLACARPDLTVTGLDSNGKMLGFLERIPLPNLSSVNARAEDWNKLESFDFVTGRAVAPLSAQLEISASYCGIGGVVVPMRTPSDDENVDQIRLEPLGLKLSRIQQRPLPRTDVVRFFPLYEKVSKTKPGYPRRWAEIKAKPLLGYAPSSGSIRALTPGAAESSDFDVCAPPFTQRKDLLRSTSTSFLVSLTNRDEAIFSFKAASYAAESRGRATVESVKVE